jgi:hypothetical protein
MRLHLVAALAGVTMTASCARERVEMAAPIAVQAVVLPADLARLAAEEVAAAVAGRNERGEEEEMLRIESKVAGFGGFYLAGGEVVALVKANSRSTAEQLRSALTSTYSAHPTALVRQLMARAHRARVQPVEYSLSELVAIQRLISYNTGDLPGWTGAGADIVRNRVHVYFRDSATMNAGVSRIHERGVPRSVLAPGVLAPLVQPICVTTRQRMDSLRARGRQRC